STPQPRFSFRRSAKARRRFWPAECGARRCYKVGNGAKWSPSVHRSQGAAGDDDCKLLQRFGVPYEIRTYVAGVKETLATQFLRNSAAWIALYRTSRSPMKR